LTSSKYSRKHAWKVDFVVLIGGLNAKVRIEQMLGLMAIATASVVVRTIFFHMKHHKIKI
jgi:hypothetical protein